MFLCNDFLYHELLKYCSKDNQTELKQLWYDQLDFYNMFISISFGANFETIIIDFA